MLQQQNPYLLVKSLYPNMHRVEKKIADFILDNKNDLTAMTIAKIAKHCEIAESSVVRFSKTLGYSGFSELKLNLASHSSHLDTKIFENIDSNDSTASIINKVFAVNISTLQNTLNILNYKNIDQAINAIDQSNKIVFFGIGTSAPIANDFYYRFMRIGLPAHVATDPHIGLLAASMLDENSVAIVISHKGRSMETVNHLRIAKEKKATTICITSFLNSPMTNYADIVLCASSTETEILGEAISSRIAHIAILDCIYSGIALKRKNTSLPHIQNMLEIMEQHRIK
jgi:DNA-binding MurR/RpiR family transcriptional regulator